ncbi:hypothetical protein NDU88_002218 [Pleurodeles waltl]|uniref:Uncharacterized protein n=1 Tax=Pleurodeles waltl TaxID=8319 RepID=A0AAV7L0N7_PLEWA|nr:hypothetical protein NDU88_002218 [Pleurodeles waltl]
MPFLGGPTALQPLKRHLCAHTQSQTLGCKANKKTAKIAGRKIEAKSTHKAWVLRHSYPAQRGFLPKVSEAHRG